MASYRTGARALALAVMVAALATGTGGCGGRAHSAGRHGTGTATTTTAITPKPCASAATCWVLVSVATLWASPNVPRPVDQPALANPARPGAWVADMTYADKTGLGGRVVSQALYGTRVVVIGRSGASWTKVAVPSQPTNLDSRGYPGWIPTRQLTSTAPGAARTQALVSTPTAWLWSGWAGATGTGTGRRLMDLSYDTTLPVLRATSTHVEVALIGGKPADLARGSVRLHVVGSPRDVTGAKLVEQARKFLGLQYLWGGTSGFGYDCSGLTHSIYLAYGVVIPRDADRQAAAGTPVAWTALRPGDLVFFYDGSVIGHVGIYIGNGDMIDAPTTGSPVRIDPVFSFGNYAGARRYLPS